MRGVGKQRGCGGSVDNRVVISQTVVPPRPEDPAILSRLLPRLSLASFLPGFSQFRAESSVVFRAAWLFI